MALLVSDIISDVRALTTDPLGVRWDDTELINWFNDAIRQSVLVKPDCSPVTETFVCAAGFKQSWSTLSFTLVALIDVIHNDPSYTPISFIKREVMDLESPDWRNTAPQAHLDYYMYDPNQRDIFYVYPPVDVGTSFELVYAGIPAAITLLTDAFPLQDIYGPAIINYIVWRAYSKDSDFSGNINLAGGYHGAFMQALTGKMAAEQAEQFPDRKPPQAIVQGVG